MNRLRLLGLLLLTGLPGCYTPSSLRRAEVLDFLYPAGTEVVPPSDVHLVLPLRVGLAFVPTKDGPGDTPRGPRPLLDSLGEVESPELHESQRYALMQRVRDSFLKVEGVQRIDIVPSEFLRPGGGFQNLDQLRALMGVDLIALISYEQVQFGEVNAGSMAYLTGVGGAIVEGNANETNTFVNTTVFDIPSRALLFHAAGRSHVDDGSTALELNDNLRGDSGQGFQEAVDAMVGQLDAALAEFREQSKSGTVRGLGTPAIDVSLAPGYTGAGAAGALELVLALVLVAAGLAARRRAP